MRPQSKSNDVNVSAGAWECSLCDLMNPSNLKICDACGTICPDNDKWSCGQCTFLNEKESLNCTICGYKN